MSTAQAPDTATSESPQPESPRPEISSPDGAVPAAPAQDSSAGDSSDAGLGAGPVLTYSGNAAELLRETLPSLQLAIATLGLTAHRYLARLDAYRVSRSAVDGTPLAYRSDPATLFRAGTGPMVLSVAASLAGWWLGTRALAFELPELAWLPSLLVAPILCALLAIFSARLRQARVAAVSWKGLTPRLVTSTGSALRNGVARPLIWLISLGYARPFLEKRRACILLNGLWLGERKLNLDPSAIHLPWVRFAVGWTLCLAALAGFAWFGYGQLEPLLSRFGREAPLVVVGAALWLSLVCFWLFVAVVLLPYRMAYAAALAGGIRMGGLTVTIDHRPAGLLAARLGRVLMLGLTLGIAAPMVAHARLARTARGLRVAPRQAYQDMLEELSV